MDSIYVLYGEESFLIEEECNKIINNIFGNNAENQVVKYSLLEADIDTVLNDASTMPFLSDKKLIICTECSFLTGAGKDSIDEQSIDKLLKYINNPNDKTTVIFVVENDKLDERKKIVKELKNKAVVKQFNKLKENDLMEYAKKICEQNKYKISSKALTILVERVENNLEFLSREIEKLMLYAIDKKEITEEDILESVRKPVADDVFSLVDAVVKKDTNKILDVYNQLLLNNEEPIKVIAILANQFRLIYQTKKLYKLGYSEKDIASKLGIHPYRVKLANEVNLKEIELLSYLEQLADLDIDIKTGKANKDIGLELFFLNI